MVLPSIALAHGGSTARFDCACSVTADGRGPYPTIQEGINAGTEGDTVSLCNGVFRGNGNWDLNFGGKRLCLASLSDDPWSCMIDCGDSSGAHHRGFTFNQGEDSTSVVAGITIANGSTDAQDVGGGIACATNPYGEASPTIRNVIFRNCSAGEAGGGFYSSGRSRLRSCLFIDCSALQFGGAIALVHPEVSMNQCTVDACSAPTGSGIAIYAYPGWLSVNNTVITNGHGGPAVAGTGVDTVDARCSDVYGNQGGDWTGPIGGQNGQDGNLSVDPHYCGATDPQNPYTLWNDSRCAWENNHCGQIGAYGIGCWNPASTPDFPVPERLALLAIQPNPMRIGALIRFQLPG